MSAGELALLFLAAIGAGAVNALAGGGSMLTFPALLAAGLPPLSANITNSVALCPGHLGGMIGQWHDFQGQGRRLLVLVPLAIVGGLGGAALILTTSERMFQSLVPWLLLAACALLGLQEPIRAWLQRRRGRALGLGCAAIPVLIAAIYGGYFGAGLSVVFLAVLGLTIDDSLTRLNALKQGLSLGANLAAAILFASAPQLVWSAAGVMAVGAVLGGVAGGRLASLVKPAILRAAVIAIGTGVAMLFLFRS